jgi:CDP-diacylglycerol--serine O-phosphatidyltransferase
MRALKRIPVLPSLLTLGNAFFGFLAMAKVADALVASASDPTGKAFVAKMEVAAILIFAAMLCDALDGKVARLTRQTSDFGAQLDSLADVITFGAAPAFLAKILIDMHALPHGQLLTPHPKIYYLVAALYVLCAVMRLARFNVETESADESAHREFVGLPSPAAAGIVASLVAFWCTKGVLDLPLSSLFLTQDAYPFVVKAMPWVVAAAGLLMVSRFPYPHLLNQVFRGGKSFLFLWTVVFLLILTALEWQMVFVATTFVYALTGPLIWLFRLVTGRGKPGSRPPDEEPESFEVPDAGVYRG